MDSLFLASAEQNKLTLKNAPTVSGMLNRVSASMHKCPVQAHISSVLRF